MFRTNVIFVLSSILMHCESASIVADINKCGFSDSDCQRELYRSILLKIMETGIPEMDIPAVDPFEIVDQEIIAMSLLKVGMPKGLAKGYKSCRSTKYQMDTEKLVTSIELVCDHFTIEGEYTLQTTPTLDALIGGIKIHGEGKATIDIENIQLNLEIPFDIKKLADCELHIVMDANRITYTYKILGKVTIAGDNLYIGNQEVSAVVVNIFNENWEFISNSLGKPVIDKALEVFIHYCNKFFAAVPLKDLISDDVSQHVTN